MTPDLDHFHLSLHLPPLSGATAAWILDPCGQLQTVIWRAYGDQIEVHWLATEPDQPIYGTLRPPGRTRK